MSETTEFSTLFLNEDWKCALQRNKGYSPTEQFRTFLQEKKTILFDTLFLVCGLPNVLTLLVGQYANRKPYNLDDISSYEVGDLLNIQQLFLGVHLPAIVVKIKEKEIFVHYLGNHSRCDEWMSIPHPISAGTLLHQIKSFPTMYFLHLL